MNWLLVIVAGTIVIGAIVGFARGAIRIAVSLAATILTILLVFIAEPYIADAVRAFTPIDEILEEQCMDVIADLLGGGSEKHGLTEDQVRAMLSGAGVSEDELAQAGISVEDIVEGRISGEDLTKYGISAGILSGHVTEEEETPILEAEIPRQMQIEAIESADLPQVFKDLLLTNNNDEVYQSLGVSTFVEYISAYLAKLIIDIAAFLGTFLLVTIIVRAVVFALDFVSELPLLGTLNRLSGMLLGVFGAMIIIEFLFVIITLLYVTPAGEPLMALVEDSAFLQFLYDHNIIMKMMTVFR